MLVNLIESVYRLLWGDLFTLPIAGGIGISFIPIQTWQDMEDEHIALVPISNPHCRRYINLSWRESSYLSPAAILFRDYLIKHFAELAK